MITIRRLLIAIALASLVVAPPLTAGRSARDRTSPAGPEPRPMPAGRGDQSEPVAPGVGSPQQLARRGTNRRVIPLCEPVRETFFISSLGSVATALGTAGYVIDRPGRYVLTGDLDASGLDIGILISATDVVLNLGGRTISESGATATLIRVDGSLDTTIIGGILKGGAKGIEAIGTDPWWQDDERLMLRDLEIQGRQGVNYQSVVTRDVRRIDIREAKFRGGAIGVSLRGNGIRSDIVHSRIEGELKGIDADGFIGRLVGNVIQAPDGVLIGGGRTVIEGNRFVGGPSGTAALRILKGTHWVRQNEIRAQGAAHALAFDGSGIIEANDLRGGSESSLELAGQWSRVSGNTVQAETVGLSVTGKVNILEKNRIGGGSLQCWISFQNDGGHVYRDNEVIGGAGICGAANIDAGANRPCGENGCGRGAAGKPWNGHETETLEREPQPPRPCEPGEIVTIDDWTPVDTPHGRTGLLIDAPGYYRLSRDLTHPIDWTGIQYAVIISSPDVTLDLGGHKIAPLNARRPALIAGAENVVLRNGKLPSGLSGMRVIGDPNSPTTAVRLERLDVGKGSSSSYGPLAIQDVKWIEIIDSSFEGSEGASWILGTSTGVIRDSAFDGIDRGLLGSLSGAVVTDSTFGGDWSLDLGDNNVLRRVSAGMASLGSMNTVEDSTFGAHYVERTGLSAVDDNLIRNNRIGGEVTLYGARTRLVGSMVGEGIEVRGESNRIEDSILSGRYCGVDFRVEGASVYQDNVVVEADEGFCGHRNIDGGGNVSPPATCGNGVKATSEFCDTDYRALTCRDIGYESGDVRCNQTCDAPDTTGCFTCGDGVGGGQEYCDGSDMRGQTCQSQWFGGGTLSCNQDCYFDYSTCLDGCGNGILEGGEICEFPGQPWGGESCASQGFEGGGFSRCDGSCRGFLFYDCLGGCGNEKIEGNEQCDQTLHEAQCWRYFDYHCACHVFGFERGGTPGCNDDCTYDFSSCGCGNGVLDLGELCDPGIPVNLTCGSQGFEGGSLGCDKSCLRYDYSECLGACGNGVAEGIEECDGNDHRDSCPAAGCRCEAFGTGTGRLHCTLECRFDTPACRPITGPPRCGSGIAEPGEACDDLDFGGRTCQSERFLAGKLKCTPDCSSLDTSGCVGYGACGNNLTEPGEVCDGGDLGGRTCQSQGFLAGMLKCTPDCLSLDVSACEVCGNGTRGASEECDGSDMGGVSCQSLGFAAGFTACTDDCHLDASDCSTCGNSIREGSEGCDGTDLGGQTCGSLGKPFGTLSCTSICTFNTSQCIGF